MRVLFFIYSATGNTLKLARACAGELEAQRHQVELADMLDYRRRGSWDGKSYADLTLNGTEAGHDHLILSQMAHVCQRSVRWGDYIYIRTYHDGFHFFPKHMLFNIKEDPHEQHNLAQERRDLVLEAEHKLFDWHDRMMFKMPDKVDPMWEIIKFGGPHHANKQLPKYVPHLEKTGRGHYVDKYKKKYPDKFKD